MYGVLVLFREDWGCAEAKGDLLRNIINPAAADRLTGLRTVLFHGAPGNGKTLLAKSMAFELSKAMMKPVALIVVRGPEVHSKWVGVTEKTLCAIFDKVKDLPLLMDSELRMWLQAKQNAPALLLIDEVDGIVKNRHKHDSSAEVNAVTQMLALMTDLEAFNREKGGKR